MSPSPEAPTARTKAIKTIHMIRLMAILYFLTLSLLYGNTIKIVPTARLTDVLSAVQSN